MRKRHASWLGTSVLDAPFRAVSRCGFKWAAAYWILPTAGTANVGFADDGMEDPRLVETENGTYVLTYTHYNRERTRPGIATSKDLRHWQKHGFAFEETDFENMGFTGGKFFGNKAGAIIARREGDRLVAVRINGK